MKPSLDVYLARQFGALSEVIAARLLDHRGSVFTALDPSAAKEIAARMLSALRSDLEDGGTEHLRRAMQAAREEILTKPFGFYDLRLVVRVLEEALFDALEQAPDLGPGALRPVSRWFSELGLYIGLQLVVQRDQLIEQQEAELELRLADARANLEEKRHLSERFADLISSVPGMVFEAVIKDGIPMATFTSDYILQVTGYSPEECKAMPGFWMAIMHPDDRAIAIEGSRRVRATGRGVLEFRWITKDGRAIWVDAHLVVMKDEAGMPIGFRGVGMDVTARKEEEEERARLQAELIDLQRNQLVALSSPLIPISDDVLVMPLIGGIDRARADRVLSTLLTGIGRARARFAILDVTGVPTMDAETADALLRAARSVQLLGAEVVLTGIRPEVAQALVTLGKDLGGIATRGTLQNGIAYAMRRGR